MERFGLGLGFQVKEAKGFGVQLWVPRNGVK